MLVVVRWLLLPWLHALACSLCALAERGLYGSPASVAAA